MLRGVNYSIAKRPDIRGGIPGKLEGGGFWAASVAIADEMTISSEFGAESLRYDAPAIAQLNRVEALLWAVIDKDVQLSSSTSA